MSSNLLLIKERPQDSVAVEKLMNTSFGPERFGLTVYKLRQVCPPIADLSYIAIDNRGVVQGSIRFWPVKIANSDLKVIILGPLAVAFDQQGQGVGKALIARSLDEATHQAFDLCLVVGDQRLYTGFGFSNATQMGLKLPGWVDPARFQMKELRKGCLNQNFSGSDVLPYV